MAVVAVWQCDRDGAMFRNKKDADDHDKMLELAENITALIEQNLKGVDEQQAEAIGLLLAKRRDILARACKNKPELLLEEEPTEHNSGDVFAPESSPKAGAKKA